MKSKLFLFLLFSWSISLTAQIQEAFDFELLEGHKILSGTKTNLVYLVGMSESDFNLLMTPIYPQHYFNEDWNGYGSNTIFDNYVLGIEKSPTAVIMIFSSMNPNKFFLTRLVDELREFYVSHDNVRGDLYAFKVSDFVMYNVYIKRDKGFESCSIKIIRKPKSQ